MQPPAGFVPFGGPQQPVAQNQNMPPLQSGPVIPPQQPLYNQPPRQAPQQPKATQPRTKPSRRPPAKKPQKPRNPAVLILILVLAGLIIGGGYWGINALRDNQVRAFIAPYQQVYAPNIYINDIEISGKTPQDAFNLLKNSMQDRINSWNLAISYQGFVFSNLNYGVLGISVSDEELYQLLNEAWLLTRTGSIHQQKAAIESLSQQAHKAYTSQKELQSHQLRMIFDQIAPYINKHPVDAALLEFRPDDGNPFVFLEEAAGAQLDSEAAMKEIMEMAARGDSGTYELKPVSILPKVTRAELEQTVALRTSIQTPISSSSPDDRNHNIRLSFSKINGKILAPGQTFSFNDVVGPRTEKAGFREALEYAYGELVPGIGGGVCQASTNLYLAAATAELTITKRVPHSGKVDYTTMGQDATVYMTKDKSIDFQFKNTTAGNIYITAHVKPARNNSKRLVTEIKMYGLSLGDGISYRLRSETVETIPAPIEKKYVTDETGIYATYTDEEKLKSKAVDGQVVETYLEKLQHGKLVGESKLITRDTFKPKPAVYYRGATRR